jgi:hypothetical protein
LKLKKNKPNTMSQPAACNHRLDPKNPIAKPVINKPSEWSCCWLSAVCTAAGTPSENTGKWAKAALKATLVQALKAPKPKKSRPEMVRGFGLGGAEKGVESGDMLIEARRLKNEQSRFKHALRPSFCAASTKALDRSGVHN